MDVADRLASWMAKEEIELQQTLEALAAQSTDPVVRDAGGRLRTLRGVRAALQEARKAEDV